MATTLVPMIYNELLEYLVRKATADEIMAFKASPEAEERAAYLIDRNNAGTLTLDERLELEQILYFDSKISVLKAKAALEIKQL